jgi:hypothetical protein
MTQESDVLSTARSSRRRARTSQRTFSAEIEACGGPSTMRAHTAASNIHAGSSRDKPWLTSTCTTSWPRRPARRYSGTFLPCSGCHRHSMTTTCDRYAECCLIRAPTAEHEDVVAERIGCERRLHQRSQAVEALRHVGVAGDDPHARVRCSMAGRSCEGTQRLQNAAHAGFVDCAAQSHACAADLDLNRAGARAWCRRCRRRCSALQSSPAVALPKTSMSIEMPARPVPQRPGDLLRAAEFAEVRETRTIAALPGTIRIWRSGKARGAS